MRTEVIRRYRELRQRIDDLSADLIQYHTEQIVCRRGCCQCCTNLTVFPIEFFAIVEELKQAGVTKLAFDTAAACGYLDNNGGCIIYSSRPLICRTQGLPLAFYDEQQEGYSVTFCPKNFADVDPGDLEFNANTTFNLDDMNDELFALHMQFIQENPDLHFTENTRIELAHLGTYL